MAAVVGSVSYFSYQVLSGPVSAMSRATKRASADVQSSTAVKVLVTSTSSTDCDADLSVEAPAFIAGAGPAGGGLLPSDIGLRPTDPWGTKWGYCVWDTGTDNAPAGCGASANRLEGKVDPLTGAAGLRTIFAIVSAGPDRMFSTTCKTYTAATTDGSNDLISTSTGKDDIVARYTYAEAMQAAGAIWALKTGTPSSAETVKEISVGDKTTTGFVSALSFSSAGAVTAQGGFLLPDETAVANGACAAASDKGMLRYNTTLGMEYCDGAAWQALGGGGLASVALDDLTEAATNYATLYNFSLGYDALGGITTGSGNMGIGFNAGKAITSGLYNTGIGYEALYNGATSTGLTTGMSNTAIGLRALKSQTTGHDSTAIGSEAMALATDKGIEVTQVKSSTQSGAPDLASPQTLTFDRPPRVGSTIVLAVTGYKNCNFALVNTDITDNQGGASGSYALAVASATDANCQGTQIFYRNNITAPSGAFTVSAALPANTKALQWTMLEIVGAATAAVLDRTGTASSANDAVSTTVATSLATTVATELVVAAATLTGQGTTSNVAKTTTAGWAPAYEGVDEINGALFSVMYTHRTTTGTPTITWTHPAAATSGGRAVMATFKAANSGNGRHGGNTGAGYKIMPALTTGTANVAAGYQALNATTTGYANTAAGYQAAMTATTRNNVTALGKGALDVFNTNTSTAAGYDALGATTSGGNTALSTAVGSQAGLLLTATGSNVIIGYKALSTLNGNEHFVAIGSEALRLMPGSNDSVAVGFQALRALTNWWSTAVGWKAAAVLTGQCLAIGAEAGGAAANNVHAIGYQAVRNGDGNGIGYQARMGGGPAGVGYQAGKAVGGGDSVGYQANMDGGCVYCIGYQAGVNADPTSSDNHALGYQALTAGSYGVAVGYQALTAQATGAEENTAIGSSALSSTTTSGMSVGVGYQAGKGTTGAENVFAGYRAGGGTAGTNDMAAVTAIGAGAIGAGAVTVGVGSGSVASGAGAMSIPGGAATGNIALGFEALAAGAGVNSLAIGYRALKATTQDYNLAIGAQALKGNADGPGNVALGYNAIGSTVVDPNYNLAVGANALSSPAGFGNDLYYNTAIGYNALYASDAGNLPAISWMTAVGMEAGYQPGNVRPGTYATAIGYRALSDRPSWSGFSDNTAVNCHGYAPGVADVVHSTCIGYGATFSANNEVRIGNSTISLIAGQVAFTATSDRRWKDGIRDSDLGLGFLMKLRPVSYRLIEGNGRLDYGFIAQELEGALDGRETNMITRQNDAMKSYKFRGADLIAPVVKAMQAQEAAFTARQADIDSMKAQLLDMEAGR